MTSTPVEQDPDDVDGQGDQDTEPAVTPAPPGTDDEPDGAAAPSSEEPA